MFRLNSLFMIPNEVKLTKNRNDIGVSNVSDNIIPLIYLLSSLFHFVANNVSFKQPIYDTKCK